MVSDDTSPRTRGPSPTWQEAYAAVLKETDTRTLFKLVEVAEAAVLTRLAELEGSSDYHAERRALAGAVTALRVVKSERLNFRLASPRKEPRDRDHGATSRAELG